eukprot:1134236-Lingulodinium_polyedra.AAC.1
MSDDDEAAPPKPGSGPRPAGGSAPQTVGGSAPRPVCAGVPLALPGGYGPCPVEGVPRALPGCSARRPAPCPLEALSDDEQNAGGSALRPVGAGVPRPLLGGRATVAKRGFVEVFAGSQTFTKVWRARGHPVFPVDIKINEDHDLAVETAVDFVWGGGATTCPDL